MPDTDLSDTQPTRPPSKVGSSSPKTSQNSGPKAHRKRRSLLWVLAYVLLLGLTVTISVAAGIRSGNQARIERLSDQTSLSLDEQYQLGLQDMANGSYEIARQRFEYILSQNPNYPGITERLAEVMGVLYATAPPTSPPTVAPTPTPDPRPLEERFQHASQLVAAQDWNGVIETLLALRASDRNFKVTSVDGMLYLSLRNRGVDKILKEGNLQGGTYDLAMAENFAPIDVDANQARDWARLYMYGLSFWEIDPEKAVFYFSQVAAAAPYLTDGSGWTATDRYRAALIQYGDLLASAGDYCNAQAQYELALSLRSDPELEEKLKSVILLCQGPTITPTIVTETTTPTTTTTGTAPSTTSTTTATATTTQSVPVTPTATATPGTPTMTQAAPTPTPTATSPEPPQDTPYPQPMAINMVPAVDFQSSDSNVEFPKLLELMTRFWATFRAWMGAWL